MIDLDRVEVLRGPQATLYGSGALGGTIKYFLNKPIIGETEGELGLSLSTVKGSYRSIHDKIGNTISGVINYSFNESIININFNI